MGPTTDQETSVCPACLNEPEYLAEFIRSNATLLECSYCGQRTTQPSAVPLDDVVELIQGAVSEEYEDAANSVPYESAEGGYQMTTYTSDEILYELGVFSESESLMRDLANSLPDYAWVERDPFSLSRYDALRFGWEEFARQVKHQTRFLFFKEEKRDEDWHDDIRPSEMLDALGALVRELGLVAPMRAGTRLYRVRQHEPAVKPHDLGSLGPPPIDHARYANRMSPAGVSMLYASLDAVTAASETLDRRSKRLISVTTAELETLRDLRVLDLTNLPPVPSVFDASSYRDQRHGVAFIRSFTDDLTQPVQKDGREHVEYVPSQVVTEYFRFRFRGEHEEPVNGILYPSAVRADGTNVVLFLGAEDCVETNALGRRGSPPLRLVAASTRPLQGHP